MSDPDKTIWATPGKWGYRDPAEPELPVGALIILRSKRALIGGDLGDLGVVTGIKQWAGGQRFYKIYINGKIVEVSQWEIERA
jgi:hypothetical protein